MTVLEGKLTELEAARERVQKQWKVLEQFSESVTKMGGDAKTTVTRLDKSQLEGIKDFFELYESQSSKLDTNLIKFDGLIKDVQQEKEALRKNMQELGVHKNTGVSRECSILLDCQKAGAKVILLVSYVMSKASWTPKYDIRVFPEDKKLKVMYYGVIQQSTEEDWDNAKLFLSTAMPSIGGIMPTLGHSTVRVIPTRSKKLLPNFRFKRLEMRALPAHDDEDCYMETPERTKEEKYRDLMDLLEVRELETKAKEGLTSTTFEVTRNSSIPSDNVGHKVTVGIIDLTPEFEYETVPVLAPHAFLKARVTNKSQYAFLPGPTNIFLDNNFVAKSELGTVSPAEEFLVSLGVDPAVRVTYKPLSKYQEKSGLLTKVTTVTYKQEIEVKNTHKDLVNIKVIDSVPRSTQVVIWEPPVSSKHPEKVENKDVIQLTNSNHVEWQIEVKGTEKREITLRYTIEYPADRSVEISTTLESGLKYNTRVE